MSEENLSLEDDKLEEFPNLNKGDSVIKLPKLEGKYYTVQTIDDELSLYHSILKVLNEDYNISNTERRRKLAKKLKKEIYGIIKDLNLNDEEEDIFDIIVKALKLNLNIYNHMGKLEKYYIYDINRNTFCLFFNNDHYCPISFISEEKHLFFNFKSDGL